MVDSTSDKMYLMKREEVLIEIETINNYLNKCLWMDFEFCQINAGLAKMAGSIDHSYNEYAIEIVFEQPYFISSLLFWHSDTSKPFIKLVTETEEQEYNSLYKVEEGNYIFSVNAEEYKIPPILIIAKKVNCVIINKNPFSK